MKVALLAGGLGTRLSQETGVRPKPMVEVGGRPILAHIMEIFAKFGHRDFYVALGYRGECIKEYFLNYRSLQHSLTIDLAAESVQVHAPQPCDWRVTLVDTGLHTETGGRLKRLASWIGDETFLMTYGDGVSDLDIDALVEFHRNHGRLATVTAVHPPSRFGALNVAEDGAVRRFAEKPQCGEGWINGGFFVFEPGVIEYIAGNDIVLEKQPLERLSADGQLMAFRHEGFWQCMDTLREVKFLDRLWNEGNAPWK